jgi:Protein of unknown function (DUF1579)
MSSGATTGLHSVGEERVREVQMTEDRRATTRASSPENALLNVFVGRWHTTGEVVAGPPAPGTKIDAVDTYEWLPGGYALIHYADSAIGDDRIQAIEIIGYDPARGAYFGPFFDDQGGAGWEEIRVDGATWTWRGEMVLGVRHHRAIATVSDDGDTITARHEQSSDGVSWQPWMKVTLARETGS